MTLLGQPKISIVTCFLNVEKYIEETIQSIIDQSYSNWELILVDDGSTDKSTIIAKDYESRYPGKILYYNHPGHKNHGLSYSRNLAIEKSTGKLIAFLDADDVWLPNYLLNQLETLISQKTDIVIEATEYWYESSSSNARNIIIPIGTAAEKVYSPPQLLFNLYPLGTGAAPCVCAILMARDIIIKHGGFDNSFSGMYEDQAFLVKLYLNENIYISSSANNRYRQHENSLVSASHQNGQYINDRKYYLDWFEGYLQQHKINDTDIKKILNKALLPYRSPLLYYFVQELPSQAINLKKSVKRLLSGLVAQARN